MQTSKKAQDIFACKTFHATKGCSCRFSAYASHKNEPAAPSWASLPKKNLIFKLSYCLSSQKHISSIKQKCNNVSSCDPKPNSASFLSKYILQTCYPYHNWDDVFKGFSKSVMIFITLAFWFSGWESTGMTTGKPKRFINIYSKQNNKKNALNRGQNTKLNKQ